MSEWKTERTPEGMVIDVKYNKDEIMDMVQTLVRRGKVAAVVHAHWITITTECGITNSYCSHCDEPKEMCKSAIDGTEFTKRFFMNRTPYCPYCGAKMDEEEKE